MEETAPLVGLAQPPYLNQIVALETTLSPRELLTHLLRIESEAGRIRGEQWASRSLDLDIVLFGGRQVVEDGLTIPHPGLPERGFWQRELDELRAAS